MTTPLSRRALLAGLLASGTMARAEAPLTSLRPLARPQARAGLRPQARPDLAQMVADAGLQGQVGVVIADGRTGQVLDAVDPATARPPASVTKAVTALYALEALGAEHRYVTRVYGTAPVRSGRLEGDLILAGGGDPNLVTDDLYALAERLRDIGVTEVTGRFLVWGGALPGIEEIDATQLDHLGYNPAISGLNLNFNRVYFEWKREAGDYTVALDARSETLRPAVSIARMAIADRSTPVYTYRDAGDVDQWTVARRALGNGGSRWLPVRVPALYCGDVFATFMRGFGLTLKTPERIAALPTGLVQLAAFDSAPLRRIMRDMLRYSVNLTAEVAGLSATRALTGDSSGLRPSALEMARWTEARAGIAPQFVDHSGLGDAARIAPDQMVRLLNAPGVRGTLSPILKTFRLRDAEGRPLQTPPGQIVAKTGTLNFVTTLAGYITTSGGRPLTFAIFASDLEARQRGIASGEETPAGSRGFNGRAKRLQQSVLMRWAAQA